MVFLEKRTVEYVDGRYNSHKLNQFMNQCLHNRTDYSISFWDVGYTYEVGQTNPSRILARGAIASGGRLRHRKANLTTILRKSSKNLNV
ncbi:hypothetical protein [Nostoc sp.]|uniref:hypothetical protein n=1 Tax=Nostoc sp. TaxID=1180 RepID=UPI002FF5EC97